MIEVVEMSSSSLALVAGPNETWSCIEIAGVDTEDERFRAAATSEVEVISVDWDQEMATVKYRGTTIRGPIMRKTDHPGHVGKEVAVLFV